VSSSLVSPVLVGRRAERAELSDALERAAAGAAQFVLVAGEAGVGKSRLVSELAADAQAAGIRVLSGQCVQLGADGLPFAPLVDALRVLARSMPRAEFDQALGPARGALLRLLPNIDPQLEDAPVGPIIQGSQLLELVLGMVERLAATGPVLLVLEDLHWADQSTLTLLAYLVRALRGVPVAVIGTFRSDELNRRHPLRSLLLAWERGRSVRRIELVRFDRQEVADQLAAILGHDAETALVDTVFERSEGNAFLVEEILGVVVAGGDPAALPQSLRDVLLSRVDGLGAGAQRLLNTAAVGGRWVSEQLLIEVSGLDEAAAFAGLREAVDQHVLVVDDAGRGYSFRHALARDAVYDDLLPGERVRLHAAYGEVLRARPELAGDDRGTLAADLAHHFYVALDLPNALAASVEAAARALDRFAPAEALRLLERALQIWPRVPDAEGVAGVDRVEVLRRAADVAGDVGEVQRSLSLINEALAELDRPDAAPDATRLAGLLERRGRALHAAGRTTESVEVLRRASELLPTDGRSQAHAAVFAELANAMCRAGRWAEAAPLARRAMQAAEALGPQRELAEARLTMAVVELVRGRYDDGMAAGRAAIELAHQLGHPDVALRGYINISDILESLGRSAEAAALAAEGRQLAERSGYARSAGAFLAGNEAESLIRLGRYVEADRLTTDRLAADPEGVYAATLFEVRSQLAVRQGRYDQARRDVTAARALIGDQTELQYTRSFAVTEALLRVAGGDLLGALAGLRAELSGPDVQARYDPVLTWLAFRTHADLAQASRDRGLEPDAVDRVFERARDGLELDAEPARAFHAMCEAELSRVGGTPDPALWEGVARRWRDLQSPYEQAECLARAAEARVLTGDPAGAAREAREAFAVASAIGAVPVVERVQLLARQARLDLTAAPQPGDDARPAPSGEAAHFGLTQREREVLAMLADGRTNPEIARALFISPKTASVHVSNILAKLGVASRVEAATLAHRVGLVTS
jgi:DNA-binding CsgD family transcriptional regulator/tetratricopeptide (TPR) repeat protein